jgi:hypothetical protein
MTGKIPVLLIVICRLRRRKKRLLEDTLVPRLIERSDPELLICILLNDAKRVFMHVKRGHQNERDIDTTRRIEMLNLVHGKVEEGHVVLDLKRRLCPGHT